MKSQTVTCQACSAPLSITSKTAFITCSYCQANLVVRRENTDIYTEKLEELDRRTQQLSWQVANIQYQESLKSLEKRFKPQGEPVATIFVGACLVVLGGLFIILRWFNVDQDEGYVLYYVGGPFFLIGLLILLRGIAEIGTFRKESAIYKERKSRLQFEHFLPPSPPAAAASSQKESQVPSSSTHETIGK